METSGGRVSPLVAAINAGDVALVAQLLTDGADANSGHALWHACTWHEKIPHLDLARLLLGAGADVNQKYDCDTALHRAAHTGNLELVQLLVDSGAALNERDSDGMAPLKIATENLTELGNPRTEEEARHQRVVDYLISKGCTQNEAL